MTRPLDSVDPAAKRVAQLLERHIEAEGVYVATWLSRRYRDDGSPTTFGVVLHPSRQEALDHAGEFGGVGRVMRARFARRLSRGSHPTRCSRPSLWSGRVPVEAEGGSGSEKVPCGRRQSEKRRPSVLRAQRRAGASPRGHGVLGRVPSRLSRRPEQRAGPAGAERQDGGR